MQNLISFLGIFVFIFLAWTLSEDRKRFPWRIVVWGLGLQFAFAVLVFSWRPGAQVFLRLNDVFNALLNFSKEGALFVFGSIGAETGNGAVLTLKEYLTRLGASSTDPSIQNAIRTGTVPGMFLAFQVLTTIIFFSALLSILYYLGIMQKIVVFFARIMQHTMRVSGAEALSNSANIFVGQTEAPLVVKPYIEKMTRSELNAIMVGGFANTAGGVLGAYILMLSGYFPNIAAHLISASILSAPAAFIVAKIMVPEREKPATLGEAAFEAPSDDVNLLDAAASGSTTGLQLTLNVIGMLFSFVALIAMVNVMVGWTGGFFSSTAGLLQLDVLLLALAAGVLAVRWMGEVSDFVLWLGLFSVAAVYGAAAFAFPGASRMVGLVGIALWVPLLVGAIRKTVPLKASLIAIGITLAVSNLLYAVLGPLGSGTPLSMQLILGWLHWPVAFLMGTPVQDCVVVGRFLGEKLILTEFVAYADLAGYLQAAQQGTGPALDARSIVIVSYALSGFANFVSIAIQIGGISPLAPSRRHEIARLGLKAMIGGAITSYIIACVAGTFYNGVSMLGL
ncbi:MAG TPA: nucleoside transporter C-terminal domain-containing protein [Terriglobia bacterium]|nr:nucleoside transporter C-terminal domain-containing protein [Terriglobia bacterium]